MGNLRFWKTTLAVGASVPAAGSARVLVEAIADPTSHNLWPLELAIALVAGFAAAPAGAVAGTLIARLISRAAPNEQP